MLPNTLYKYRDDSERTTSIITSKQVWLSTPDKLNDPLECNTGIITSDIKAALIYMIERNQIAGFVQSPEKHLFSKTESETKKWFKRFQRLNHSRRVRAMRAIFEEHGISPSRPRDLLANFNAQLAAVGVFSLSADPANELMWAHYAGSHTGLAFGFSTQSDSRLADKNHCLQVDYSGLRPVPTPEKTQIKILIRSSRGRLFKSEMTVDFTDPTFRAAISTKTPSWAYEKEWRYVEERGGLYRYPSDLSTVIFGARMPTSRREFYTNLIKEHCPWVALKEVVISEAGSFSVRSPK